MKIFRIGFAIACTLMLAACLPETKTPIGTTVGLGADEALLGTWKSTCNDKDKKAVAYSHFLKKVDGTLTAVWVEHSLDPPKKGEKTGEVDIYALSTATLKGNHYINAVPAEENDQPADDKTEKLFVPLLYTINNDTLTLYLLDEDKVKEAIEAGKIAGEIKKGDIGESVTITADAQTLDAFMATPEAARLFKVFAVLKRQK